jgi:hypothetical protein
VSGGVGGGNGLLTGLIELWPFNANFTGVHAGIVLSEVNSPTIVPGDEDSLLAYMDLESSSTQYCTADPTVYTALELETKTAISAEMWLNYESSAAWYFPWCKGKYQISFQSNGATLYGFMGNGAGTYYYGAKNSLISNGTWVHLGLVFDGSGADNAARLKLYVDGSYVAFDSWTGTIPAAIPAKQGDGSDIFCIGNYYGTDEPFDGKIKQFALYGRALSADEMAMLYNGGTPLKYSERTA